MRRDKRKMAENEEEEVDKKIDEKICLRKGNIHKGGYKNDMKTAVIHVIWILT